MDLSVIARILLFLFFWLLSSFGAGLLIAVWLSYHREQVERQARHEQAEQAEIERISRLVDEVK